MLKSAQNPANHIIPTDVKSLEYGMPSGGTDFLKGYPKPHSDPGVLQQLQGLRAQLEEGRVDKSWHLQPLQLPAAQICPAN